MTYEERTQGFVREIWKWFDRHKRDLPWRDLTIKDDTERAYRVLVSEVMLQQTQVSRVIIIYKRFLLEFPTLTSLAKASNREVLLAWRGMGYNSRALRLRDAARTVIEEFHGEFPQEMCELESIKGIGHYTAAAIRNFAFHLPTPCIDTNIRRVLHRTFIGVENADGTWKKDDAYLLGIAEDVLAIALRSRKHTTADWHAALMDFGSLVCTKRHPKWDLCPLAAKKLSKAAHRVACPPKSTAGGRRREPGRYVGSTYIPNRIFRGKIVEELRDATNGLSPNEIGRRVCIDWDPKEHQTWLSGVLKKLESDFLIERKTQRYVLCE